MKQNSLHGWLLALICVCATTVAAQTTTSLDKAHPIVLEQHTLLYDGQHITLDAHHLLVDALLPEGAASPYAFRSFQEAAAHLTDGTEAEPMCVYIAPYVYWIDNPDDTEVKVGLNGREPFGSVIRCNHLHLIGLTSDAQNVVLASQRGQTQGAIGNFTMFDFWGDGLQVRNLTMGNFCNVDLVYPLLPSLNRAKRNPAITQAHVAYVHGDKVIAENVRFISRLNMNPLNGARRILFKDCHMECADDALTGNGVYLHCDLDLYANKPFWRSDLCGAVFLDCDFHICHSGPQHFCKSPGPITLIDCRFHSPFQTPCIGWTPYPPTWLRCYQSNVTLNNIPYIIGGETAPQTVDVSHRPLLSAFKQSHTDTPIYNTFTLLRGDDDWNPLPNQSPQTAEPQATCLQLNLTESTLTDGDKELTLIATAKRHADYAIQAPDIKWHVADKDAAYLQLTPQGNRCQVRCINREDSTRQVVVYAETAAGLQAAALLTARPATLQAPQLTCQPHIVIKDNTAVLNYTLDLGARKDQSSITWYRCSSAKGTHPIAVAVSRFDEPLQQYRLSKEDVGCYLMAVIQPKHLRSDYGAPVRCILPKAIKPHQAAQDNRTLETDFRTFPTAVQPEVISGYWTVDAFKPQDTAAYPWEVTKDKAYWTYDKGFNGAVGYGLLQTDKGARLRYTPLNGSYGDMEVELLVDPTKTAGQGFGSATGQYMDVCLKFNTTTLTGYALRIIRTTKYANAVDFLLVQYKAGVVTPLTEPVSAICYRTGCTLRIQAKGNRLTAQASTTTPLDNPTDSRLSKTVALSAPIEPNAFGGFAIQHTGSAGESTTQLHRLKISWE